MVDGATTASPLCTERIAVSSSEGGTSLSMNPLAPALRPVKAYSSRSKVVRISTFGGFSAAQIRRVASTPSRRGIRTSISTTSVAVERSASIASTPSLASATTSMSGWAESTMRKPVRSSAWSSTSITRIGAMRIPSLSCRGTASCPGTASSCGGGALPGPVRRAWTACRGGPSRMSPRRFQREQDADAEAAAGARARVQRAADHADAFTHPDQPLALAVGAALPVQLAGAPAPSSSTRTPTPSSK